MILLPVAAPPPVLARPIADPAQGRAVAQCEKVIARKAGGEISAIDVTGFHRTGRQTSLNGTVRVLQKPATRPGEMTPTHVVVMPYSYKCRLNARSTPRIKLAPLDD